MFAKKQKPRYDICMNILAPLPARLVIEIVYDFVCPWCYLGVKRLSFLLQRRQDLSVDLVWRPFLLNPDMPRAGMSRVDYMIRKFGAEDRARRLYSSIAELGAAEGILFNFSAIRPHAQQCGCAPAGPPRRAIRRFRYSGGPDFQRAFH